MAKAKKSAAVKLSPEKLQELKNSILAGESPKSINEKTGVSLFNIQYHKRQMKKKGLLGNAASGNKQGRGRKPASAPAAASQKTASASKSSSTRQGPGSKAFKLIVNGVSVHIDGAAAVSVGEGFIKVDY